MQLQMTPLLDALDDVPYELMPHRHTESAVAEAAVLGPYGREVAKTVVIETPDGFVRAVLPVDERLDLHKVRAVLGTRDAHLASEETLAGAYPQFELGAVPPVGGPPDPVLVDRMLVTHEWIVLEAGTHDESVRLQTADFLRVADARLADLCEE